MARAIYSTPEQLELFLGDLLMGRLYYRAADRTYAIELLPEFLASGHDIAPIVYPRLDRFRSGLVLFHGKPAATTPFPGGLPGFIVDSLPDKWGQLLLSSENPARDRSIMGSLVSVGAGGPGAITYCLPGQAVPVLGEPKMEDLAEMAQLAERIAKEQPVPPHRTGTFGTGGTLGGAYPKVGAQVPDAIRKGGVISLPRIGIGGNPARGFLPGIVKFSPVNDDESKGRVEYAFHLMAQAAGLRLPSACLLEDGAGGLHFAVERFDRVLASDGSLVRLHVQSLSAMLHENAVGAIRYEDLVTAADRIGGPEEALEAFRRVVFNLLATNRDDHGRNHAFLYDWRHRLWSLAPAYDLNPSLGESLNAIRWGDGSEIPQRFAELLELATLGGIAQNVALNIFRQIDQAVTRWPEFALIARVDPDTAAEWGAGMNSETKQAGPLRADARGYMASDHGYPVR
jgi:serine/threonine-protein kinase HipA